MDMVQTGSGPYLQQLIRLGYVDLLLAGHALATHDIEQAMFGTSLGAYLDREGLADAGHGHHLRAINRIRRVGGIQQAVVSRFRGPQRQGEEPLNCRWFSDHGYRIHRLKSQVSFEGAGDALSCGDTLFAGYRIRSEIRACQELGELLACRVAPLELVQPRYYHLDTCFCPLTVDSAIYYPRAFDEYGRRALRYRIPDLIPVEPGEACRLACNAVVLGKTVTTGAGCPRLHRRLRDRGFTTLETTLDEFIKAGGSAKCLTLRLDGEDAASWRTEPCPPVGRAVPAPDLSPRS
jgi:N-dimethylarginine dimethylaminohydrolase